MVVLGGAGSLAGAAVAAVALILLREVLRPLEQAAGIYGLVQIVTALILIATLLLRPQGLFGGGEPRVLRPVSDDRSAPSDRPNRPAAAPAEN